jgi:hypothetical protein
MDGADAAYRDVLAAVPKGRPHAGVTFGTEPKPRACDARRKCYSQSGNERSFNRAPVAGWSKASAAACSR